MTESKPPKKEISPFQAMEMVWDVGIAIAVPTVAFGLGGRWLDKHFGTSPLFLIAGLFVSLAVTGVIVTKMGRKIAKRLS